MSWLSFVSAKFPERRLILFIAGTVFEDKNSNPRQAVPDEILEEKNIV